ncbi:MAG: hypothetical protein HYS43_01610 [Candidatus Liptonbacteria bacterium]|nr:hypothetical protein [Candidatus Liptonbacteria bacterium]
MRKYTVILLSIAAAGLPLFAGAQMMGFGDTYGSGWGMMRYIEGQALGSSDVRDQMEALMDKLVAGTLTEQEANQMVQFMKQNPAPFSMMMNRVGGSYGRGWGGSSWGWSAMHSGLWGGAAGVVAGIFGLVFAVGNLLWLAVAVLAVVWLWKKVVGK